MKKTSGFSMVELMVVVSIIGILTVLGQGKYRHYKAKSYQTEAKLNLARMYAAQTTYFSEKNSYTTCVENLSMKIIPEDKRVYAVGFGSADPNISPCPAPAYGVADTWWSTFWPETVLLKTGQSSHAGMLPAGGLYATQNTYKSGAHGYIANDPGSECWDGWSIDHNKLLINHHPFILTQ